MVEVLVQGKYTFLFTANMPLKGSLLQGVGVWLKGLYRSTSKYYQLHTGGSQLVDISCMRPCSPGKHTTGASKH